MEVLADSRCPLCRWVGCSEDRTCPECGYGLVDYRIVLHA